MPKYACICGCVMNLSHGWSDFELTLVPESTIENVADRLDSGNKVSSSEFYELMDKNSTTVYRCPNCMRLHLENERNKFTRYVIE